MNTRISMRQAGAIAAILTAFLAGCGREAPEELLSSAKAYLAKKDNKAAEIQLKNALQQKPDLAEARFLLGATQLDSGEAISAEKELRKALELGYPAEKVVPLLARSMVLLGQHKEVVGEFGKTEVAGEQGRAELQSALAQAHMALGNVTAAKRAFAEARTAQPRYVPAHLGEALIAATAGDFEKALALVDAALSISPHDEHAWQLKGNILLSQEKNEPAMAAFRHALEAKPGFLPAHSAIVMLLLREKNTTAAEKQLNAMKQIAPKHPQVLYLQALLAYQQQDFTAARDAIQQQLKMAPDNLQGLLLAGAIAYELQSYAQSETHLQKVLRRAPDHRFARRMLVAGYLRTGQASKALDALGPDLNAADNDPYMLTLRGEVYMLNGDLDRAAEYFQRAVAVDPEDASKRTTLALVRMQTGETDGALRTLEHLATTDSGIRADLALIATHMRKREYDQALAAIAKLEKKQPANALSHNLRGLALLGKRDRAGARRSFKHALSLDVTYVPAAANLANMDLAEKNPEAARQHFDAILSKDPKNVRALLALAELRAKTGGTSNEVVELIKKAVSTNPDDPAPRVALIGYYVGTKDSANAVVAARDALAVIPGRPELLDAAGRAYQAAGDINQALTIYSKLASLQPRAAYPHLRIAELHVAAKNKTSAIDSLRRALSIEPDLVAAQRGIMALQREGGRLDDAIATARQVQKQRPKQSIGYLLEGDLLAAEKKWAEATNAYRTGLKQSGTTDLAVRLHNTLLASGDKGAEQFANAWIKEHPKDDAFRFHVAQSATAKKDYATAVQHYRKLLEHQPSNAFLLNNLAWAAGKLNDPKALEYGEQANKLAPNQPVIMDTLAMLLMEKGHVARALELLQQAATLAPQAHEIRLNYAKSLIKAGKTDAARKELAHLAKLGSKFKGHAEVERLIQSL